MRRLLLLLPLALLAVPLAASHAAGSGACDKTKVGELANAHGGAYDPHLGFARFLCHDFTRDGIRDAAFTINSGGSSGTIGWGIVHGLPNDGLTLAKFAKNDISPGLKRSRNDVLVSSPIYGRNDPACCPRGFHIATWRWNGHRFRHVKTRRVRKLHGFF
jgi:hypothetical protein